VDFIKEMADEGEKKGVSIGKYSSYISWTVVKVK
jgi:hypothetical protein